MQSLAGRLAYLYVLPFSRKANKEYFWRDDKGNEVDGIIDEGGKLYPIEIKSGLTVTPAFFKGLHFWNQMTGNKRGAVIYAGENVQKRSSGITVIPWNKMDMEV